MHRAIFVFATFVHLGLSSPAFAAEGGLISRFEQLRSAVVAREPIDRIRPFFSDRLLKDVGSSFTYEWLDYFVGRASISSNLVERVRGSDGCLAYAVPYRAQAPGPWVELSTFTYSRLNGQWLISDLTYSISAHHNVVDGGDFCNTLGWPWK